MLDYAQARRLMVDCQLRTFDVNDGAVLDAFGAVARERFVPAGREEFAYIDQTLSLDAAGRAMPAPMLLARMIQALAVEPGHRILDVATGYGYGAAILRQIGAAVVALESVPALAAAARERLEEDRLAEDKLADRRGVEVVEGPIASGVPQGAPYHAILVNGRIELRPQALLDQLRDGGRLVCVLGRDRAAKATLFVRTGDAFGARPLFDASLPGLGAFAAEPAFAF